ncbi:siphovirus ReqiPepy6 Gp37-like family protein [Plantactinospora alkalitolerans]|nr:siphovirus ReqiPepy6 Gp37-like family protein [Plantactinospora alkalitolerans]
MLVTDANLAVVGDPIVCWMSVDCTARFNAVGSGVLTVPAYPWIREQIQASHRVVVIRDRRIFLAGPIEQTTVEQSDDGENSGIGTLTVDFADDLAWVAARITFPNPAQEPDDWLVDDWTATSVNAEQILHNLVNLNAGPGALAARRVPALTLGDLQGIGNTITMTTRLEPLVEVLRRVASNGGGLGFRTRQVGNTIEFQTYQPQDLSGEVRFGFGLGNLRHLAYERSAPTATTVLVGGQGEGTARFVTSRTNTIGETVWGRTEKLVARSGDDAIGELEQAGDEALVEEAETVRLQSSAWDTDTQRYPDDYDLGARVSIQVGPGEEVSDLVRLVHLQAWATAGELVSAMVGSQEASNDPQWVQRMRALDRRLGHLERITAPTSA